MKNIAAELTAFVRQLIENRSILLSLAKNDFKAQYMGNYLGMIWAFTQPLIMLCIMWFVFQVGFKATPVKGIPFILWLACGMIPWFFFAESISKGTSSILDNSFMVKKIAFRASTLPLVKLATALVIHLFFILLLMAMFIYYGYKPNIFWLQLPYFVFCSCFLSIGLSWLTSSIIVFVRDIAQVVAVGLQLGFWLTPIFWSIDMVPVRYQFLLRLNPVFYIVDGYRNTFIDHEWFWNNGFTLSFFMMQTCILLVTGAFTFRKLRPHFADVL